MPVCIYVIDISSRNHQELALEQIACQFGLMPPMFPHVIDSRNMGDVMMDMDLYESNVTMYFTIT